MTGDRTNLFLMKKFLLLSLAVIFTSYAQSQADTTGLANDSTRFLQSVVIKAYEQNRRLIDVAAPIGYVSNAQLNRFSNNSILPALNITPGVRMEERSPGSYRVNIRGSSLRSPFGVRDVKIYFNDVPLTDPGGNTYLNGLGFYHFQSVEIVKGPAGSLYGAGIGGAMLIRSLPARWENTFGADISYGAYHTKSINVTARFGNQEQGNVIAYTHQSSDGYRVQTSMRRDIASWDAVIKSSDRQRLHAFMLYSDLYYQTPGALNLKEFTADPKQARPPAGVLPGAVQNQAAIYQKTFLAGFSDTYTFNSQWQNTTGVYGSYTNFTNPGIRVYEKRTEPHFGGRTVFQFRHQWQQTELHLHFGAEAQKGFFNTKDFANKNGNSDTLQTDDEINNWQYMVFGQADLKLGSGWIFTLGASLNKSSIRFTRVSTVPPLSQIQNFNNKIAPRLAVLKKLNRFISIYASTAKGFSPPTVSELLKTNGLLGTNLQAADGIDYEGGLRGSFLHDRLFFDLNAFFFHLRNTIVQRIDTNNVFYYVNAGSTRQNGFEAYISWLAIDRQGPFFEGLKIFASGTLHNFHYHDFKQVNNDFGGNRLPGVAPQIFVIGFDIHTKPGLYLNFTYTYTGHIFLNDANTDVAGSYQVASARIGYRSENRQNTNWEIYLGGDNLSDTKYSLGNDINAAAGRYYNAAPGRNFFGGISLRLAKRKADLRNNQE